MSNVVGVRPEMVRPLSSMQIGDVWPWAVCAPATWHTIRLLLTARLRLKVIELENVKLVRAPIGNVLALKSDNTVWCSGLE